jgi:proline racemase
MNTVKIVDSHTGGEPTRVVVRGGPSLGKGTVAQQLEVFRSHHDAFRSAIVNEPRGSDVMVGALLVKPAHPECRTGVIFFNNVGFLGMCGHGTIGLVATLAHLGRLEPSRHPIETPVGPVTATLHRSGEVSVANVPSFRKVKDLRVQVPELGWVTGDVAWGGNWFFLVSDHRERLELGSVERLTDVAWRMRQAVNAAGFPEVDHVELFGPPQGRGGDSKNFVLCPGKAYDRSPCGTGTSAKLACLAADGKLDAGEVWVQEGILGSAFKGRYRWVDRSRGEIAPVITGRAFVNAASTFLLNPSDPYCWGIRTA